MRKLLRLALVLIPLVLVGRTASAACCCCGDDCKCCTECCCCTHNV